MLVVVGTPDSSGLNEDYHQTALFPDWPHSPASSLYMIRSFSLLSLITCFSFCSTSCCHRKTLHCCLSSSKLQLFEAFPLKCQFCLVLSRQTVHHCRRLSFASDKRSSQRTFHERSSHSLARIFTLAPQCPDCSTVPASFFFFFAFFKVVRLLISGLLNFLLCRQLAFPLCGRGVGFLGKQFAFVAHRWVIYTHPRKLLHR